MNRYRSNITKKYTIWFAVVAMVILIFSPGFSFGASAAQPVTVKKFHLYATDGTLTLPDGVGVYVWGFSQRNDKGTASYPAPVIEVNEGDAVEVTLTNIGPKKEGIRRLAHTIHFHGLDTDQANDGVPHTSRPIQVGESFTYRFIATHAGTYFYHCHVDTIEHLQMGMFGSFIVKAKGGAKQAWTGGPSYDKDYTFILNEIDPVWHKAVEEGRPYDRTDFHPRYWTINGKSHPDTESDPTSVIEGKVGQNILVRLINAGYEEHSFHLHGTHFLVIASDGRPLPAPIEKDTIRIAPGERYDLMINFTQSGHFPFHSHNIVDNTNNGVYPGGLHTMANIEPGKSSSVKMIVLKTGQNIATVNGKKVKLPAPVQVIRGTSYVPYTFLAEQFGGKAEWNKTTKSVTFAAAKGTIRLWLGQKKAQIGTLNVVLSTPPILHNGTVLVPLRFVAEHLGGSVSYNSAAKEIMVQTASVPYSHNDPPGDHQDQGTSNGHGTTGPDDSNSGNHSNHGGQPGSGGSTGSGGQTNGGEGPINPDQPVVYIENSKYSIAELKIKAGTKVTWVNNDSQIHTSTDLNDAFDSGNILPKGSWSFTFAKAGTYTYYCTTHPSMEAKIIVE